MLGAIQCRPGGCRYASDHPGVRRPVLHSHGAVDTIICVTGPEHEQAAELVGAQQRVTHEARFGGVAIKHALLDAVAHINPLMSGTLERLLEHSPGKGGQRAPQSAVMRLARTPLPRRGLRVDCTQDFRISVTALVPKRLLVGRPARAADRAEEAR